MFEEAGETYSESGAPVLAGCPGESNRTSQDIREMVHALPSLRGAFADAFGTLDTKKIKTLFENDPDKAIERLADAMAKAQSPAGGLNNDLGKLYDAGIELGRQFGTPILEPFSDDVKSLTYLLRDNKSVVAEWGQSFADALRGISDAGRGLSQLDGILGLTPNQSKELKSFADKANPILRRVGIGAATFGYSELYNGASFLGEQQRHDEEARNRTKASIVGFGNIDRTNIKTFLDPKTNTLQFESESEKIARLGKDFTAQTAARQKELLSSFKSLKSEQPAISESYYKTEESRLTAHHDYTTAQEAATAKSVFSNRQNSIDSQISPTKKYYADLFKFGDLDKTKELKAARERNAELAKLGIERLSEEFKQQKQALEFERKIQDERRQALIEYKNLQIEQSKFGLDNNSFDISRFIDAGISSANEGFDKLKELTQSSCQDISRLTIESYQTQLQNLTLTKEQRLNLTTEMYLSEQKLAEENRRKISQIEDEKFQRGFENFKQQNEQIIGQKIEARVSGAQNDHRVVNLFPVVENTEENLLTVSKEILSEFHVKERGSFELKNAKKTNANETFTTICWQISDSSQRVCVLPISLKEGKISVLGFRLE